MPDMHFKSQNLKFLTLQHIYLPNSLPAIRPDFAMARAPVFHTTRVNASDL